MRKNSCAGKLKADLQITYVFSIRQEGKKIKIKQKHVSHPEKLFHDILEYKHHELISGILTQ